MTAPSAFAFSLACGVAGAWVDVTSDVLFEEGSIPFTDGRTSQFDGFGPGTFSFTLKNGDGKYTPENSASSLAVPLSEGMGVTIQIDALLLSGTIRNVAVVFPPFGKSDTARVRVTCDDMLGNAARNEISDLADALFEAAGALERWRFDDAAGSAIAVEDVQGIADLAIDTGTVTFGVVHPDIRAVSVVAVGASAKLVTVAAPVAAVPSTWNFWVLQSGGGTFLVDSKFLDFDDDTYGIMVDGAGGVISLDIEGISPTITGPTIAQDVLYFVSVRFAYLVPSEWEYELLVDGVSYGVETWTQISGFSPIRRWVSTEVSNTGTGTVYFSNFTHAVNLIDESNVAEATAAERLVTIAATTPEVTLDTVPDLAPAILGEQDSPGSTLDALNEVMRAEQGYMWVETTGSLLAPVPKIKVAARDRERPVDYNFDVSEILDPIPFIRTLSNTVSLFTASGPETSATYQDTDLIPLVGSASSSDSVPLRDFNDLWGYASDRVVRGEVHGLTVASITIDATSPDIDRWADLTAIRQGYRLHITGLPQTQLGYDTWDGFVVGRQIDNTQDSRTDEPKSLFTFHLAPVGHATFTLDTDVLAAGESLTLTSNITDSATSFSVTFADARFTTSANFPHIIRIGSECMTLTAVSGTTTPQTFTVTRGATDPVTGVATVAVAHTAGDIIELADPAVLGF